MSNSFPIGFPPVQNNGSFPIGFPPNPSLLVPGIYSTVLPVTSGLFIWYDASNPNSVLGANGSTLPIVRDLSGNAYHASQATGAQQATINFNSLNSLTTLTFNGSNRYAFFCPSQAQYTFVFVAGTTSSPAAEMTVLSTGGVSGNPTTGVRWLLGVGSNGTDGDGWVGSAGGTNLSATGDDTLAAVKYKIKVYTKSTTVWNTWSAGYQKHTNVSDTSTPSGVFNGVLGCERIDNNTYGLNGSFAEAIIFNRVITTTERLSLEAYLHLKWGV